MKNSVIYGGIVVLLGVSLIGCTQAPMVSNNPPTATTLSDRKPSAKRIVALLPLGADLVHRLNASKLVGVPSGSYIDKDARFKDIPRVGERSAMNLEKIIALKPDLVIGSDVIQGQLLDKLKQTGIDVLPLRTSSWQDLEIATKSIADLMGADPMPILQKYQSYITNPPQNGQSVLVIAGIQPTSSPNKQSWAGDLLSKFGYRNIVADFPANGRFQGYLTLSQEKILEMNPDKIFLIEGGGVRQRPEEITTLPFWKDLKAAKNNQVYIFHHDGLISPTSVDTVEAVTAQLRQAAKP
ncbi:ABC transporter substrate-binding protein [Alkalinema pantanalense CENA528]|uniref:ABC transporter substrate-binding protein n=1 Tax=Alkalinema pantanalense TaxID=1620705 RepID=UPI003D6EE628